MFSLIPALRLWLKTYIRSERGQDLIEYALLGGLIAAGLVAVVTIFGGAISSMASGIQDCIDFTASTTCDAGP